METFEGTDKDMKCYGGFQYELGKTYVDDGAIRCGDKGIHSCEVPMDVLSYFEPTGGNRFFFGEATGEIDRDDDDSKISSSEFTLKAEIGIAGLIKAQVEYVKRLMKGHISQEVRGHAAAQGDWGHAAAQGYRGHAAAQGYRGHAAAQGDRGHAAAQGDWGYAEVHGKNSIAVAFGVDGRVMGSQIGQLLTLYQWELIDNSLTPISSITVRVDGDTIKPGVWYRLDGVEFVEADEE